MLLSCRAQRLIGMGLIRSAIVGGAALLLAAWLVGIVAAQTNSSEAHIPPKSQFETVSQEKGGTACGSQSTN